MTNYRPLSSCLLVSLLLAFAIPALPQGAATFTSFDAPAAGTGALQGTIAKAIDAVGDVAGSYIDASGTSHGFIFSAGGTLTPIDVTGAGVGPNQGTFAAAMDAEGDVAGYYRGPSGGGGFVRLTNGTITPFKTASDGSEVSLVLGINSVGYVTGNDGWVNGGDGYVRSASGTSISFGVLPGGGVGASGYATLGVAINTAGVIAGRYFDNSYVSHGFVRAANATITTFDPPGVATTQTSHGNSGTIPTSIDTAGDIAGTYTDTNGARHSFVRTAAGVITTFDPPGADSSPCPSSGNGTVICGSGGLGINDAGQIVGGYIDANGVGHGFLRAASGNVTSFDAPHAGTGPNEGTAAFAINAAGTIAGTYIDANSVLHGFVGTAAPAATTATLTALQTASVFNEPANFTATISSSSGTPPNGELVYFTNGSTQLGSAALTSGVASFMTTALPVGADSITASYAGDTNFAGSTSAPVSQTVGKATSFTTLTSSLNPSSTQQSVTFTATVSGQFGGTPSGSVTFSNGGATLGSASLSGASASITTSALPAGTDSITAVYAGDTNFGASTSNAVSQMVTQVAGSGFVVIGTAVTVAPGATTGNTSTITLTPNGGFTGSVALTAAITSSPSGAVQPPILSFGSTTPVNIAGTAAGTATLTIATTLGQTGGCTSDNRVPPSVPWYGGGGAILACVLLLGIPARRRGWRAMLGMLGLLAVLAGGMMACSGGGTKACAPISEPSTTPGTYTITVTGISGTTTNTGTVTLTVQ